MSASLVGSEMCIRDRASAAAARAAAVRRDPGPGCGSTSPSCVRSRSPVSYTHLTLPTICSV
eukprot:13548323-Alexandrium_andersonii.AAC.1